jgi:putative peptidoglycan lipid II flippase
MTKAKPASTGFLYHAKLISLLTLLSRILGVFRESLAAKYFGAGLVSTAFTVAFTIPNLFRRLFGEGALSAAFIPLYSQSLKHEDSETANRFAAASVNLLIVLLLVITVLGELILWLIASLFNMQPDRLLAVKLTAIMLPYVLLVCGTAFLGAILQVHRRFGLVAAAPIVLNIALIGGTVLGAKLWNMQVEADRVRAVYLLSAGVLVAGILQIAMLLPALRAVGFRFDFKSSFWTPAVQRMLKLSMPVAIGAGVLQFSVLLDRGISFFLAQSIDRNENLLSHFTLFGHVVRYPLEFGAAARLGWAQYLYQFPLGVFAIALATAIFPTLSADALDADRQKFLTGLRRGFKVTLWEGLPASVGLILVAQPAVQLLFERGNFKPHDSELVARSVQMYAIGIWAFSLQQILNRAYYAMHDTWTPLILSVVTLIVNLVIELPLLWTGLGEAGMAVGTTVSFVLQTILMLWILRRKTGPLGIGDLAGFVIKLLIATAVMTAACVLIHKAPFFPRGNGKETAPLRLLILIATGGIVYVAACLAMGVGGLQYVLPNRRIE